MKRNELDNLFLGIMNETIKLITDSAAKSSEQILNVSQEFLSKKAHKAISDFHNLYFSTNAEVESSKLAMNRGVDDIIDQVQSAMGDGLEVSAASLAVDEGVNQARLQLSAVQKDLEALITMEEGLRERLAPVLSNMQFEDGLRQRLEHIGQGWKDIIDWENNCLSTPKAILEKIKDSTTSVAEEVTFYQTVLEEEPPEDLGAKEETIMFF